MTEESVIEIFNKMEPPKTSAQDDFLLYNAFEDEMKQPRSFIKSKWSDFDSDREENLKHCNLLVKIAKGAMEYGSPNDLLELYIGRLKENKDIYAQIQQKTVGCSAFVARNDFDEAIKAAEDKLQVYLARYCFKKSRPDRRHLTIHVDDNTIWPVPVWIDIVFTALVDGARTTFMDFSEKHPPLALYKLLDLSIGLCSEWHFTLLKNAGFENDQIHGVFTDATRKFFRCISPTVFKMAIVVMEFTDLQAAVEAIFDGCGFGSRCKMLILVVESVETEFWSRLEKRADLFDRDLSSFDIKAFRTIKDGIALVRSVSEGRWLDVLNIWSDCVSECFEFSTQIKASKITINAFSCLSTFSPFENASARHRWFYNETCALRWSNRIDHPLSVSPIIDGLAVTKDNWAGKSTNERLNLVIRAAADTEFTHDIDRLSNILQSWSNISRNFGQTSQTCHGASKVVITSQKPIGLVLVIIVGKMPLPFFNQLSMLALALIAGNVLVVVGNDPYLKALSEDKNLKSVCHVISDDVENFINSASRDNRLDAVWLFEFERSQEEVTMVEKAFDGRILGSGIDVWSGKWFSDTLDEGLLEDAVKMAVRSKVMHITFGDTFAN